MKRAGLLSIAFVVCACSSGGQSGGTTPAGATAAAVQTSAGGTQTRAGGGVGGGGGSLLDKARAVKHVCDLLPADLVPGIIDNPTPPQEEQFPPRCSVYGAKTAMEFSLDTSNTLGDPPADAKKISGLGTGAYLQNLTAGNPYLSVGLSSEGGILHAEVNNSDGKDHTDEVVKLAKAVIQKLGG